MGREPGCLKLFFFSIHYQEIIFTTTKTLSENNLFNSSRKWKNSSVQRVVLLSLNMWNKHRVKSHLFPNKTALNLSRCHISYKLPFWTALNFSNSVCICCWILSKLAAIFNSGCKLRSIAGSQRIEKDWDQTILIFLWNAWRKLHSAYKEKESTKYIQLKLNFISLQSPASDQLYFWCFFKDTCEL